MKKSYQLKGKTQTVEELSKVVALKPAVKSEFSFRKVEKEVDPKARQVFHEMKSSFSREEEDLKAFSNAGWIFTSPTNEALREVSSRENTEYESHGKVYKNKSGKLLIGTARVTVKLDPSMDEAKARNMVESQGYRVIHSLKFAPNLFEIEVNESEDSIEVANHLNSNEQVVYAEPQFLSHVSQRLKPSDPLYGKQWQLDNSGQNGGTVGADVQAEKAWDIAKGKGVRLAIIDNGFDINHSDLKRAIDSTAGYFSPRSFFINSLSGYPSGNHGTFCAGMAIAQANNSGIVGVAYQSDFIPVACLNDQVGTQTTLARAIAYAADPSSEIPGLPIGKGADVIACSLGPNGADWEMESVLQDAIDFCVTKGRNGLGTPVFWAVSNGNYTIDGRDGTDEVSAYKNTIAVGRSNSKDSEDGSAFGDELDFLAPGASVFSCRSGGGYGSSTGTSFAAPLAAGVGALLLSKKPTLKWTEVRKLMQDSCDKIGGVNYDVSGRHETYGFGRINAYEALKLV